MIKEIEQLLDNTFKENNLPGFAVIINSNDLEYMKTYGYYDIEQNLKFTEDTKVPIGCITKPITAYSVLNLCSKNNINISEKLVKFIKNINIPEEITIKDVLCHRTGVGDNRLSMYINSTKEYDRLLKYINEEFSLSSFRDKYAYSTTAYVLLSNFIESLTGISYEEYIIDNIFELLNMNDTTFLKYTDYKEGKISNIAKPYSIQSKELIESYFVDTENYNSSMGILTTSQDMSKLSNYLVSNYKKDLILKEMSRPIGLTDSRAIYNELGYELYGLGINIGNYNKDNYIYHAGNYPGFSTYTCYFPNQNIVISILCNLNNTILTRYIAYSIYEILSSQQRINWNRRFNILNNISKKINLTKNDFSIEDINIEGTYSNSNYGEIMIKTIDGDLCCVINDKKHHIIQGKKNELSFYFPYFNTYIDMAFIYDSMNTKTEIVLRLIEDNEFINFIKKEDK